MNALPWAGFEMGRDGAYSSGKYQGFDMNADPVKLIVLPFVLNEKRKLE